MIALTLLLAVGYLLDRGSATPSPMPEWLARATLVVCFVLSLI